MLKGKLLIEHCWLSWFYSNLIDRLWNVFFKINLDQKKCEYTGIYYIFYMHTCIYSYDVHVSQFLINSTLEKMFFPSVKEN